MMNGMEECIEECIKDNLISQLKHTQRHRVQTDAVLTIDVNFLNDIQLYRFLVAFYSTTTLTIVCNCDVRVSSLDE